MIIWHFTHRFLLCRCVAWSFRRSRMQLSRFVAWLTPAFRMDAKRNGWLLETVQYPERYIYKEGQ